MPLTFTANDIKTLTSLLGYWLVSCPLTYFLAHMNPFKPTASILGWSDDYLSYYTRMPLPKAEIVLI